MKTCGHCPHCRARVRFWRMLRMTNWHPYRCPECQLRSEPDPARALWLYALTGGLGGMTAVLVTRQQAWWTVIPAILVVAMISAGLLMLLCPMRPLPTRSAGGRDG